ncbi:MAG: Ig-like domain-containing protein, partial [Muribaculum sp.]|nr:Ig-like domain-containing protein [Muribaculum sp.]
GFVIAHSKIGVEHITATASNGVKGEIEIEVVETPVTKVNFVYNQLHLYEGQTKALEVEIYPETATNKTLKWSVSDESVLSIDDNGVITALKSGKAYVWAIASNEVYGSLLVVVDKPIECERIDLESNYTVPLYTDDYGQIIISELTLEPKIYPEDAVVKGLEWTSSNENVGKVTGYDNNKYTFRAYSPGKTTLTCKATDGSGVTATCEVEVVLFGDEEIGFSIDGQIVEHESTVSIKSGETVLIDVTFHLKPTNPSYDDPTLNFSSNIIDVTELSQEPLDNSISGYKRRYAVKGLNYGESAFVFFAYNTAGRIWINVTDNSGIDLPEVDESLVRPIYYDLQGNRISGINLLPGIYIKKTGPTIEKVFIQRNLPVQ